MKHDMVEKTKELLIATNMKIHWVKAHADFPWNEEIDLRAKFGTLQTSIDYTFSYTKVQIRNLLNEDILNMWQNRWNADKKGRVTFAILPRVDTKRLYGDFYLNQALTEHGNSDCFKNRFFGLPAICRFCQMNVGDFNHYILECNFFESYRRFLQNFSGPLCLAYIADKRKLAEIMQTC